MAGHLELYSFVGKFWNLWRTGQNARMSVECQAGKATVNLQLDLGLPHYHHPQEHHEKRVGPSRIRRCAQRAQALPLFHKIKRLLYKLSLKQLMLLQIMEMMDVVVVEFTSRKQKKEDETWKIFK